MPENYDETTGFGGMQEASSLDIEETKEVEEFWDEDENNLVPIFSEHPKWSESLKAITESIIENVKSAYDSSEEYRQRIAKDHKLLVGAMEDKSFPYSGCANINIPILLENTLRLHARLYSEIFGDWKSVMGVTPVGPDDQKVAETLSFHGNWQLRQGIPDFQRQMERALLNFLFIGDVTCSSYYDSYNKRNRHDILSPDDFVIPYTLTTTMPDYSDVPYYAKIMKYGRHELQKMRGQWHNVDKVLDRESSFADELDQPIGESSAETLGLEKPDGENYKAPYTLYHYEGWCSLLPNQRDDRFIQAIVDPYTRTCLKLCIYEEISWQDKAEQDRKNKELELYNEQMKQYTNIIQKQDDDFLRGAREALTFGLSADEQEQSSQVTSVEIPVPEVPSWVDDPDNIPSRAPESAKKPIRMFSHGVLIEPVKSALGVGYGRIQSDFTRTANTMANQFLDAATLSNAPPIFTSGDIPEASMEYSPGKIIPIETAVEDLAKSVFVMPQPQANPQLMQGVDMMVKYAQSSIQAPDVLSGTPGKSGETYRGISSRIEQATKQLSVTGRKFSHFLKNIIQNNAKLNSLYLPEFEILYLMNHSTSEMEEVTMLRKMYERNYQVEIHADLKFTPQAQEEQSAMEMVTLTHQLPSLQSNLAIQYKALVEALKAQGKEDWIPLLGPPPPPPQQFGPPPPPPMPMDPSMAAAGPPVPPEGDVSG